MRFGIVAANVVGCAALQLGLARVLVLQKKFDAARAEYRAFLAAWKDADPQAALLLQAKQEYAKLPSL